MGSSRCRTLILAGLWGAGLVLCAGVGAALPVPVRLAAPLDGGVLQEGSLAELAWEPLAAFAALEQSEEWEAFLSLDGGAHYTVRITPHLDRDLRRVLWQVPPTPTTDARLLLRFGNERVEAAFELPQRFTIAGPPAPRAGLALDRVALGRGEPALPGQAGVVSWVEGTRRGGSLRAVTTADPPSARSRPTLVDAVSATAFLEDADGPAFDPSTAAGSARRRPSSERRLTAAPEQTDPIAPLPILLSSRRRNE
jgi:hypothetical protein